MATKSKMNVAEKIIEAHMVSGDMTPGEEVGIKIDLSIVRSSRSDLMKKHRFSFWEKR